MKLYKKFLKRMETDNGYDNEKLAKDLQTIAEKHQYKQLNMHVVVGRSEQLVAYTKWLQDNYNFEYDSEILTKEYIKSN